MKVAALAVQFSWVVTASIVSASCPHPFIPENGHVVFDAPAPYASNTVARYSCAPGFDKIGGTNERICLSTGSWSGEAPVCVIDVAEGKPTLQSSGNSIYSLKRGTCTITDNLQGSWWEVDLLNNYVVHGIAIRLGKQSSPILNVYMIQQDGDLTQCDLDGYSFVENTTVYVKCEIDQVEKVQIVAERKLHLCEAKVYAINAVSSWQCSQGTMDVLGVFDGLCYSSSKEERADWQGAQRRCLDRGATLPMKITETAQRGLRAALSAATHQKDFYWIEPKTCTFPGISAASRVSFTTASYAIGTTAVYTCEIGYELNGESERLCDEDGRWTGIIPECKKRKCDSVEVWHGGGIVRLLNETTEFGNEIQYECLSGWELFGEDRRRCQHDGTWSGSAPQCKVVNCETPPSIPNGRVTVSETTYKSLANYSCAEGYRLIGHASVSCAAKGSWEPGIPVCYDMATLRELKGDTSENHAGLAALGIVIGFGLVLIVYHFTRNAKSININDKPPPSYSSAGTPPGLIYMSPSMLANSQDSVVYYASSIPMTKMEIPPHLLSLKQLPNGNIQATLPIGRPVLRPHVPNFRSSPTPSQLLYSFDYEPIYDVPPDMQRRRSDAPQEENIYEKLPDVKQSPS